MLKLESKLCFRSLSIHVKGCPRYPDDHKRQYNRGKFNPRGTTICRRHLSAADTHRQLLTYRLRMVGRRTAGRLQIIWPTQSISSESKQLRMTNSLC